MEPREIVFVNEPSFLRFAKKLNPTEFQALKIGVFIILATHGIELLVEGDKLISLGQGLFELRLGPTSTAVRTFAQRGYSDGALAKMHHRKVLIRVFVGFPNERVVVILGAYNKLADSSKRNQQLEIGQARNSLKRYVRDV